MTQMVTRCPKCSTAFRITSTQLESAKGAVRCGSCLHIFKAQDFLVNGKPAVEAPATKPAAPKPASSPQSPQPVAGDKQLDKQHITDNKTPTSATTLKPIIDKQKILADEDDELISDDMDKPKASESSYEFDGFFDVDLHPKQTVSLFEREIRYEEKEDNDEKIDESWANELLDDDEDTEPLTASTRVASPAEEEIQRQAIFNASIAEGVAHVDKETKATLPQPNAPLFSLVSEPPAISDEETEFSEAFLSATRQDDEPKPDPAAFAANLFDESSGPESEPQQNTKPSVKKTPKIRGLDNSRASLLMNIIPAPVEFTAKRMRRWYQQKLWPTLAFLAAVILFFQVAYFKFDYFSRVEPYRTAYVFACPVFHCKVPNLIDKSLLQANSLVVHGNPDVKNALFVDANLLNIADFEQPFPDLLLTFTTLNDAPVAARRFTPKEYLGGELAGRTHIPSKQPVHITLEIVDPGADAVNYTLTIP